MQIKVHVEEQVIRQFLEALFEESDGYAFTLGHKQKKGGFRNARKPVDDDLDPIIQAIRDIDEVEATSPYISANLFSVKGDGRKANDVVALRALVVDIDFWSEEPGVRKHGKQDRCVPVGEEEKVDEVLHRLHGEGMLSFVLDTGHGRQAWLLLPKPSPIDSSDLREQATALTKGFAVFIREKIEKLGIHSGVDGKPDIAHVWRIAGTVNRKGSNPAPVTYVLPDNGVLSDLY